MMSGLVLPLLRLNRKEFEDFIYIKFYSTNQYRLLMLHILERIRQQQKRKKSESESDPQEREKEII